MEGTLARARAALRSPDFERLFAIRLVSQFGDGLFQTVLVASVVFSPEHQTTTVGFAKATAVIAIPFSVIGPFTGVFIDRWSRRRILVVSPVLRAALAWLVLFSPVHAAVPFYAGALIVLSINRFFLATAVAVVPRLVPTEDLLMANSLATVGGTVALLAGVFVGGQVAQAFGDAPVVVASAALWLLGSLVASRIVGSLSPHRLPEGRAREEISRIGLEMVDGLRHLAGSPRALGPITSITLDQVGQGVILTLSLVVLRERFKEGVGSFSTLIGAGGVGVLVGLLTVGKLEERMSKERIVAWSFAIGGLVLLTVAPVVGRITILFASFAIGITFAWKKVPVDTMVQQAIPDAYRGRVFAVYDVAYQMSRVIAGLIAIRLLPALGVPWSVAVVGLAFAVWAPVLPLWVRRSPALQIRFYAGATAEETPRSVIWGGVEERVEVQRAWREERGGTRLVCFRLVMEDGTRIDVSRVEPEGSWRLDRELSS